MRKFFRRIHFLLNRRRMETELAEEMAAHREMMADDGGGAFGREIRLHEDAREIWGWMWLDRLGQDLRYALRTFRRTPGFSIGAIAVLALGVGANIAEFHVFDAALLHRLNLAGADTIYHFYRTSRQPDAPTFPYAAIEFFGQNCRQCAFVLAERGSGGRVVFEDQPDASVNFVSGNYFPSLPVLPAWGRLLDTADAQPGAPAVAVLGHEFWRDHEGSDPHIVNTVRHVNGKPVLIVGVLSSDFDGLQQHSTVLWMPVNQRTYLIPNATPLESFAQPNEDLYARPKPGVSVAAIEGEFTALIHELAQKEPSRFHSDERVIGERLAGSGVIPRQLKSPVYLLFALVLLVLLSACANLGNMLLARGFAREREIAIRMGLGAERGRVIRQLLTENFLLALIGTIAALFVGRISARLLLDGLGAPPWVHLRLDWQILVGAGALAILSTIAFGLPSALQMVGTRQKSGRRRNILVGVQVAISSLLLICSGILAHNAVRSATLELNFDYRNMAAAYPAFYGKRLAPAVVSQKLDELIARVRQLPGVDGVTTAVYPPLSQRNKVDHLAGAPPISVNFVAPDFFEVMNLPVLQGRTFRPGETDAVIVSESAARNLWPSQNALGKVWDLEGSQRTIVGIVRDSGVSQLVDERAVEAYAPLTAPLLDTAALVIHVRGNLTQLVRAVPAMSASLGEQVSVLTMARGRDNFLATQKNIITVIGAIGLVATVLAAAGMFAMVAFTVAQRTREFGIRMAIGARPRNILWNLLDQAYLPVAIGMAVGVALGIALGKAVGSLIEIINDPLDPMGFGAGIIAFALIAALATLSPALRALRIDPSSTLRYE